MFHLIWCWITGDRVTAIATCIYAFFTVLMYWAIRRQVKLMRESVVSTFRPKLVVRRVFLCPGTAMPTIGVPDAYPWKVEFVIANIGGSPARIKTSSLTVSDLSDDQLRRPLPYAQETDARNICLKAGEERGFSIEIEKRELVAGFRHMGTKAANLQHQQIARVYFFGYAAYADDAGVIRKLAVLRHYDLENGKFEFVGSADHEYAD